MALPPLELFCCITWPIEISCGEGDFGGKLNCLGDMMDGEVTMVDPLGMGMGLDLAGVVLVSFNLSPAEVVAKSGLIEWGGTGGGGPFEAEAAWFEAGVG